MQEFPSFEKPVLVEALICFYDMTNFAQTARTLDGPLGILQIMQEIAMVTERVITPARGTIVKYIGDAAIILFPDERVDAGVQALLELKKQLEASIVARGLHNTFTFSLHFGEIAIGALAPFSTLDLAGDAVNIAATLARAGQGFYHGRFLMTPQVFRKLAPQTRKLVHKFTPPIVYMV